jgi:6-phospho-beta-glucosidase
MAAAKIVYIGGGSTRAPGTVLSFIEQAQEFAGSEIALLDIDDGHLELVRGLAESFARARGADLTFTATTDRAEALQDADAVLTSFRPGGFEARYLDESIPLSLGVIGQETQGPGGFFMALRSIAVMKEIVADIERLCPRATIFNYTNPVNVIAEAVTHHSDVALMSLCEGPIVFGQEIVASAGLDPDLLDVTMVGLNHGCWSIRHLYDGADLMPILGSAYAEMVQEGRGERPALRMIELALAMGSLPASYFQYYYFTDEIFESLRAKPTTRAQDIMADVDGYWEHYLEQSKRGDPRLDPARSRTGVQELELAVDVMDAVLNDKGEIWPVNVPNRGAIADFPDDLVVEVPAYLDRHGANPLTCGSMPKGTIGLVGALAEYQALTAEAAWGGDRRDAVLALSTHPLVRSVEKAEQLYAAMSAPLAEHLPERLR